MKKHFCSILFVLGFVTVPSMAGKYTASFLQIGAGARFMAMGGSGLAVPGDVSCFYWNPAGLATIQTIQIQLMYATQYGGFRNPLGDYQYAGVVIPIKNRAVLACNWIRFAVNDIPLYPELEGQNFYQRLQNPAIRPDGEAAGYFRDVENAFFISFSKNNQLVLDLGWQYLKIPIEILPTLILHAELKELGINAGFMDRVIV